MYAKYIKTVLPSDVDKDVCLYFTFEDDGWIELIVNERQEQPFNGWSIYPHHEPVVNKIL